uniref:Uncharacterized protein n=1 Tax=Panagrolaimus sp. PS1159 TaxID=55785 RepID=A0AC35EW27_9BILA
MEAEKEIQPINQNQQLKKSIKETEALLNEIDDQHQAKLKEFMDEKKELTAKLFGEVDKAREKAEEELRKVVEENVILRILHNEQSVQNYELGLKVLEIPGLKASIKRYDNKVASLEDELKMSKELRDINNNAAITTQSNKENVVPDLNMQERPSTSKESKSRPQYSNSSTTEPSKAPSALSWADRLKIDYKNTARKRPRISHSVSMPKEDPKV